TRFGRIVLRFDTLPDPYVFTVRGLVRPAPPPIAMMGNGLALTNGSSTPDLANHTDFGRTIQGDMQIRTFTVRNTSGTDLSLGEIRTSAGFELQTPPAMQLAAGEQTTLELGFTGQSLGLHHGQVQIVDADGAMLFV